MKKYPILIPIISSIFFWFIDALSDLLYFHENLTYLEVLFTKIPPEDLFTRAATIIVMFASFFIIKIFVKESIIQKKSLQEKLILSQKRFELAAQATSDGMWDLNVPENQFYFGPKFYMMLGYEIDEFEPTFKNWINLIHPDDIDNAVNIINIISEKGQSDLFELEMRMKTKNGTWKWILSRGKVVEKDAENHAIRILGTNVDITRRKKIEKDLENSEQRLRITFENIADGILVFNKELRLELINRSAEKIIHYTEDEAIGKHVDEIFPIETFSYEGNTMRNLLFEVLSTKKTKIVERAIFHCTGNRTLCNKYDRHDVHIEDGISLIQDEFGKIEGVVIVFRDITEKVKAEEVNNRLQDELQHSLKMEAIDQFSGGIAHDFNNIITAINGFNEIILSDLDEDDDHYNDAWEVKQACNRAADLTSKLLAFNRKQVINPVIIDINESLINFKSVADRILDEDINIEFDLKSKNNILFDITQLDQILFNLIGNARDAINSKTNKAKEKNIKISTEDIKIGPELFNHDVSLNDGDYVLFQIEDNGSGMSESTIDKIFDPFFTTKEKGKGTGLGLSMVYGIVRQHKGGIFVESKIGVGSKFKIYLPKTDKEIEDISKKEITSADNGNNFEKILFVEDEPSVQKLISNYLTKLNYEVVICNNGIEALDIWNKTTDFDLIVTDVIMPQMSGYELIEEIQKKEPNINVLYISGYSPEESLLDKNFISKPFSLKLLSDKIRMILNAEKQ